MKRTPGPRPSNRLLRDPRPGERPVRPNRVKRPRKIAAASSPSDEPRPPRLQQVLATAGFGSRRQCETLIVEGRVEVDGAVADQLGTRVDPLTQQILVDGEVLKQQRSQYFMVNKPPGVVSTSSDPSGRMRVIDLIKTDARVYNVGRLDRTSEGLIIVTNDGELANRLTHPSFEIEKRYLVEVAGSPPREQLEQLEKGVQLAEGLAKASRVAARRSTRRGTILEITLREGRNREIRRLMASVGHKVLRLKRIAIGPIVLGELASGDSRRLTSAEVAMLKGLLGTGRAGKSSAGSKHKNPTEQMMLADFRGHAKRAARKRADQKLADKTPSQGRAASRQVPIPRTRSKKKSETTDSRQKSAAPKRQSARLREAIPAARGRSGQRTMGRSPSNKAPSSKAPSANRRSRKP